MYLLNVLLHETDYMKVLPVSSSKCELRKQSRIWYFCNNTWLPLSEFGISQGTCQTIFNRLWKHQLNEPFP